MKNCNSSERLKLKSINSKYQIKVVTVKKEKWFADTPNNSRDNTVHQLLKVQLPAEGNGASSTTFGGELEAF